ncbi:CaiB/BaiF CoA transferase family protein [Aromatoleum diolicum]|uniref:CoA transferase n=1 Tax=Aromatoleum diolicum TaxID=75796 RepID=A0ABX1Q753_9RHOO|nr:CaiB/BaiF CoA-transferase family protein [Aromatoleum diolicum]NMG74198.1 CoA transferase [Aromatoleum diolicum]
MAALSHVRVLDLSRILAGPLATQILADLGADVIKIERPDTGDDTRSFGPPFVKNQDGDDTTESAYYSSCNRNKKSVAIDISRSEGQELIYHLAATSDVFIENFKVGTLKRYGLDYETLSKINPRLIYCSITGFGQDGPYAQRPGYDFLIQGMGGLMSVTGRPDGEPGAGPQKAGLSLADITTGLYATISILAALAEREQSGLGQQIDLALLDVQVACLANQAMNFLTTGKEPVRMGNGHPNVVPYQDLKTKDGYMILAVGNDGQFSKFCLAVGHPEWAEDQRFRTNATRVANRQHLIPLLNEVVLTRTTAEWIALFEQCGVPCGPINGVKDVFADPQVVHRGMQIRIPHRLAGEVPLVASPIRLSRTPVEYLKAPPMLGENSTEVLSSLLGVSAERIEELKDAAVVGR